MKYHKVLLRYLLSGLALSYFPAFGQETTEKTDRVLDPKSCQEIKNRFVNLKRAHSLSPSTFGYILISPSDKQVLELDESLTPLQPFGVEMGNQNRPESLFKYPLHSISTDSQVFVTDLFSQSVKIYSEQASFEGEILLDQRPRLSRFALRKELIAYTSDFPDCSIRILNTEGEIIRNLGKGFGDLRSIGDLFFLPNGQLLRIGNINPTIELYDPQGDLVFEHNLTEYPKIQEAWEWAKNKHYLDTTKYSSLTIPIVNDAFVHHNKLYILLREFLNYPVKGKYLDSKKIIVFEIKESLIQYTDQFYLSEKYAEDDYSTFCISKDGKELLAFNYLSKELCVFDLD